MQIQIRGEKFDITSAMKKHVNEKIAKINKYFENPEDIKCYIVVRTRDKETIIEVTVPTKKFTLRAEESHNDFYAAVDLVIDKLERQIRKNKTRLNNKYKNVEPIEFNLDLDIEDKNEDVKIVKRKNMTMKPMDEEEAILQAELLNHDFFVFKNIDEECVSVIYKRSDDNYGIINVK